MVSWPSPLPVVETAPDPGAVFTLKETSELRAGVTHVILFVRCAAWVAKREGGSDSRAACQDGV